MIKRAFEKLFFLRWLAFALIFFIVIQASVKIIKSPLAKGDFEAFFHASKLIVEHQNIYLTPSRDLAQGGLYYLYLPLLAVLLIPLTFLPIEASVVIWNFFNAFLVFWVVKTFYEMMSGKSFFDLPSKPRWVMSFFPIFLTLPSILHHLAYGQANILTLALTILGLSLLAKRYEVTGGLIIGLAVVIKIIAAPMVIWLITKKFYRAVGGVIIGGIFGAVLFPSLILGFRQNFMFVEYWLTNIVFAGDLGVTKVPLGVNLSLQAQLYRFFTSVPAFSYHDKFYSLTIYTLSLPTIQIISHLFQILVLLAIAFYSVKFRKKEELISKWGGIALAFALIPLFATTTQKHYFVMLLPSFTYAVYVWYFRKLTDKWFRYLLAASFFTMLITIDGIVGNLLSDIFTALGFNVWGTILLVICIFRIAQCPVPADEKAIDSTGD